MWKVSSLCLVLPLALVCSSAGAHSAHRIITVVPSRSTSSPAQLPAGTVASLHEAQAAARAWRDEIGADANDATVEVRLLPGRHELDAPLVLDSRDSSTKWIGIPNSVVSGGKSVAGWAPCPENAAWLCSPPLGSQLNGTTAQCRHLYVNGRRAQR